MFTIVFAEFALVVKLHATLSDRTRSDGVANIKLVHRKSDEGAIEATWHAKEDEVWCGLGLTCGY
jgi:hypothetical protein